MFSREGEFQGRKSATAVALVILVSLFSQVFIIGTGDIPAAAETNDNSCIIGKSSFSECLPDKALARVVSSTLGKGEKDVVQPQDVEKLHSIDARYQGIEDLDGLQYFTNLDSIQLSNNQVTTLTPLSNLANLTELNLYNNSIDDVSVLSKLKNLKVLGLGDNNITDVAPLASLTALEKLNLSHNHISDIAPLSSLKDLRYLWAAGNDITDATVVNSLPSLQGADLSENDVTDASKITSDPEQYLVMTGQTHSLSETIDYDGSISAEMPIGYDGNHIKPVGISNGGTYDPSTGIVTWTKIEYNGIGLVARYMSQGGGKSGDRPFSGIIEVSVHINGSTANSDDLQSGEEETAPSPDSSSESSNSDVQKTVSTTDCSSQPSVLSKCFADSRLSEIVAKALKKSVSDTVTPSELASITEIQGDNAGISSIEGLQYLPNLTSIYLSGNSITDISPLANLSELYVVSIYDAKVSDVSALANKPKLWGLGLGNNQISDISTIINVPKLAWVDIYSNDISDVSVVKDWPTLNALWISGNPVTDVSPIASVKGLRRLQLESNGIDDMSAFQNLEPSEYSMNDKQSVVRQPETVDENASVTLQTVKGRMGQYLTPTDIFPAGGVYDPSTGVVTWTGVTWSGEYRFSFSESDDNDYLYSGKVGKRIAVNHKDTTKPVITGVYDTYSTLGEPYDCMYAVKATDDTDGDLTSKVVIPKNAVNVNQLGTYPVQYYVEDSSQNFAWSGRHVTVTNATLQSIKTYPVYTTVGVAPDMGNIAQATWSDGKTSYEGVIWNTVDPSQYASTGQFRVSGEVRGKQVETTVYVSKPKVAVSGVSIQGEAIHSSTLTMHVGQSTRLTPGYSPSNASADSISWNCADASIATVSESGQVSAVSAGTSEVSVTADGYTASVRLVVTDRFSDVPTDALFANDIDWLYSVAITKGNSDGTYGYGTTLSRQDMAIFLYRLAVLSGDESASAYSPSDDDYKRFSDVNESSFGAREILWLASKGVVKGNTDGTFRGTDRLSRQDMAVFLHRYFTIES